MRYLMRGEWQVRATCGFVQPNGSDIQRRGRFPVPKPMRILTLLNEARKRRAGAGPRPLLWRVGQRLLATPFTWRECASEASWERTPKLRKTPRQQPEPRKAECPKNQRR